MPEIHVDSRQVAASVGQAIENALNNAMTKAVHYDDLLGSLNDEFTKMGVWFSSDAERKLFRVRTPAAWLDFDSEIEMILASIQQYASEIAKANVRAELENYKAQEHHDQPKTSKI